MPMIQEKIEIMLRRERKTKQSLAQYLGISYMSLQRRFAGNGFSSKELRKIADRYGYAAEIVVTNGDISFAKPLTDSEEKLDPEAMSASLDCEIDLVLINNETGKRI